MLKIGKTYVMKSWEKLKNETLRETELELIFKQGSILKKLKRFCGMKITIRIYWHDFVYVGTPENESDTGYVFLECCFEKDIKDDSLRAAIERRKRCVIK